MNIVKEEKYRQRKLEEKLREIENMKIVIIAIKPKKIDVDYVNCFVK